ncbi:MAG: hypothetical protein V7K92_01080 [Nostoc sp.]|uniref:hypothetical protein n=1 Tax=Nostoc sp. TaxID=1180 RepID=UPI002FF2B71B
MTSYLIVRPYTHDSVLEYGIATALVKLLGENVFVIRIKYLVLAAIGRPYPPKLHLKLETQLIFL